MGRRLQNKGMALFPRRINNLYAMLSRQDNENIYLMYSRTFIFGTAPSLSLNHLPLGVCAIG